MNSSRVTKGEFFGVLITVSVVIWVFCMVSNDTYSQAVAFTLSAIVAIAILFAVLLLFEISNTVMDIREHVKPREEQINAPARQADVL